MKTKISQVQKTDIPRIVYIHKKCIEKTNAKKYPKKTITEWAEEVNEENIRKQLKSSDWLKLKVGDQTVGFCQFDLEERKLYQIQILPRYQGKGYGSQLYNKVEETFTKVGCSKIKVFSTKNAEKFYDSKGFKKVRETKYPLKKRKVKVIEMEKDLSNQ